MSICHRWFPQLSEPSSWMHHLSSLPHVHYHCPEQDTVDHCRPATQVNPVALNRLPRALNWPQLDKYSPPVLPAITLTVAPKSIISTKVGVSLKFYRQLRKSCEEKRVVLEMPIIVIGHGSAGSSPAPALQPTCRLPVGSACQFLGQIPCENVLSFFNFY